MQTQGSTGPNHGASTYKFRNTTTKDFSRKLEEQKDSTNFHSADLRGRQSNKKKEEQGNRVQHVYIDLGNLDGNLGDTAPSIRKWGRKTTPRLILVNFKQTSNSRTTQENSQISLRSLNQTKHHTFTQVQTDSDSVQADSDSIQADSDSNHDKNQLESISKNPTSNVVHSQLESYSIQSKSSLVQISGNNASIISTAFKTHHSAIKTIPVGESRRIQLGEVSGHVSSSDQYFYKHALLIELSVELFGSNFNNASPITSLNSGDIVFYLDQLMEHVKYKFDSNPHYKTFVQTHLQHMKTENELNSIDYKDILYLFGLQVSTKGLIFDINYSSPNGHAACPITSLGRACFFNLPIDLIKYMIKLGCKPDDYMFTMIPYYKTSRVELLQFATDNVSNSLDNSLILNYIISNSAWDILDLAIKLGAKPIFSGEIEYQTMFAIQKVIENHDINDRNNYLAVIQNNCIHSCNLIYKSLSQQELEIWNFFFNSLTALLSHQ